jgi:hypothetical protein
MTPALRLDEIGSNLLCDKYNHVHTGEFRIANRVIALITVLFL